MLNKMSAKKKYVPVKANGIKKKKSSFVRKQQRLIADMKENKKAGSSMEKVEEDSDTGPSVEIKFAQRLAANDPKVREKAIKKFRKWIQGSFRSRTELDMLRLWKGLHYCFWMSDKPLLQEELAENISNIIHCFDPERALMFFKCFLVTLGREWIGIDRWRTDKFMMFARRVLRQSLLFVMRKVSGDENDILETFVSVYNENVMSAADSACAIGFKLHFADIFMEELTKVNATFDDDLLTDDNIETMVEPFLRQIVEGEEDRLVDQIEERIFNHLIRQSDVALAYEEGSDDDMEDQLTSDQEEENEDENGGEVGKEEDRESKFDLLTSDPRAGVGDVCLPQLDLDYNRMAEVLFKAGGEASVGHHQRKRLYAMSKRFQLLASGVFPFAAELNEEGEVVDLEAGIEEINVGKEINKERREAHERSEQAKKERDEYRQALKDKRAGKEPPQKKPKLEKKSPQVKKKGNKEKSRERIEKFMKKKEQAAAEKARKAEAKSGEDAASSDGKPKKPKKALNVSEESQPEVNGESAQNETEVVTSVAEKKKKKKKTSPASDEPKDSEVLSENENRQISVQEQSKENEGSAQKQSEVPASDAEKKKKKKKTPKHSASGEPKDLERLSEDGQIPVEEQSKANKMKKKRKSPGDDTPAMEEAVPKKAKVEGEGDPEEASAFAIMKSKKVKKSKKKDEKENAFELDNSWDEPLKEGEFEIVEENPNYKGKIKLAKPEQVTTSSPAKKSKESAKKKDTYETPTISTPKKKDTNGTPTISTPDSMPKTQFFRKSASQSAQKDTAHKKIKDQKDLTLSEPIKKTKKKTVGENVKSAAAIEKGRKLNFAISQNKYQSLLDVDRSMQESPEIPFDAERVPTKGLLKVKSTPTSTPKTGKKGMSKAQSVMYNTMMNSKSPFAAKRRPMASDFF